MSVRPDETQQEYVDRRMKELRIVRPRRAAVFWLWMAVGAWVLAIVLQVVSIFMK